jgi:hypothetical protein
MGSPFDQHRGTPPEQRVDLFAWCVEQNDKPIFRRMERWYFLAEADGITRIDSLDGTDANNVRKMIDGTLADFAGWSASRMGGYRRWLWSVAERGTVLRREAA